MNKENTLEQNYYLKNFSKLTDFVEKVYKDLLNPAEKDFLHHFKGLPLSSQQLYIRLISRKGPLFRVDKLNYPEIESLELGIERLEEKGFLALNKSWTTEQILPLFTKPELIIHLSDMCMISSSMKRDTILDILRNEKNQKKVNRTLSALTDIIQPLMEKEVQILRLLFFGNLYQNLSEFVITDLDVVRYEPYRIDRSNRLFRSRRSLNNAFIYNQIGEEFHEKLDESITAEEIIVLAKKLPDPGDEYFLIRKRDRLLNELSRQLERLNKQEEALNLYTLSSHTPARERRTRILFCRGDYIASEKLITEILNNPLDEEEKAFALFFLSKIYRKRGVKIERPKTALITEEKISCVRSADVSVELASLHNYKSRGYGGYYVENTLWNGLFGLAFWDIIFAPLGGAFYNSFQRGPSDLNSPEFHKRREALFEKRFNELSRKKEMKTLILHRFEISHGITNAFVSWKHINKEMISRVLKAIPAEHLLTIFKRISLDVRGNSSGFPDLILFPPKGLKSPYPYILAEVKGPGDKLQKNQKRWISVFEEKGIPFQLVLLKWS